MPRFLSTTLASVIIASVASGTFAAETTQKKNQMQLRIAPAKPGTTVPTGGAKSFKQQPDTRPDFAVKPVYSEDISSGLPGTGFCKKPVNGGPSKQIKFRILNVGGSTNLATTVYVEFQGISGPHAHFSLNVPPMSKGATISKTVSIPSSAYPASGYHGSANFKIYADSGQVITEPDELNNNKVSKCMAPAS